MFKNKMSLRLRIFISMILLVFTATLLVLGSTYYQYRTESDQYNSYRQERKENQLKRQINYQIGRPLALFQNKKGQITLIQIKKRN